MSLLRETIEAEIKALADKNSGIVTPQSVVDLARDPGHPFHEEFEWVDSVAAEQFRLSQARTLIRSIRLSITTETVRLNTVAYIHNPDGDGEQGYVHVGTIRTDKDRAKRALAAELERIRASAIRARDVAAGVGQGADIERLILAAVQS